MVEDVEEERKFQAERDRFQRQFEVDQSKFKVREVRLGRIFIVKKNYLMEKKKMCNVINLYQGFIKYQ